eukprot:scpid47539/ scgid34955/ DNA polymerase beta
MATQRKAQSAQGDVANVNSGVVNFLLELADYEKNVNRHVHKYNVYRKAAHTIAKCATAIGSGAEAQKLDGIGDKIGKKIDEFLATGKLQKLDKIRADPRNAAIAELTGVTGIGPAAAAQLVKDGITSVAQLRQHTDKLNHHQRIGLQHNEDFKERIPRTEMTHMEVILLAAAKRVDPQLTATICGSYRRGAKSSGDVDCLIAHPSFTSVSSPAKSKQPNSPLHQLVRELKAQGFITDEISHGESKFAGVCRRPLKASKRPSSAAAAADSAGAAPTSSSGSSSVAKKPKLESADSSADADNTATPSGSASVKQESGADTTTTAASALTSVKSEASNTHAGSSNEDDEIRRFRRLDLRLIPHDQYACGILYFTGSDMFNKQMRAEALEVGFTLNEYSLRPMGSTGVPGEPVQVTTERDVFDAIGMDYREPSERNV